MTVGKRGRKAQVTIFVIIAILIAGTILGYYLIKGRISTTAIPKELLPPYNYFLSCITDDTKIASSLIGSQAGFLETPEFSPGSDYMPFSSQLDFLGMGVPYWYYISGNNIAKEQIPSTEKMEEDLETYLKEEIKKCDFEDFRLQGFVIETDNPEVNADIKGDSIEIKVEMPILISYGDLKIRQTSHSVSVDSKLGELYNTAKKIYEKEKDSQFLENYGVDVLRLYAPVDGSEIGCSPKIWDTEDIRSDLIGALEANVPAIKIKGSYYSNGNKYFIQDIGEKVDSQINFIYLKDWPMKMEVWPSENGFLSAEPVGLQEGLGILGFCYVPYHFVYDIAYPVLIQIQEGNEMFQFPIAIVIDKNKARTAENAEALQYVPELCQKKLTEMKVSTYDAGLNPVEARIKFKCFDTTCNIGNTIMQDGEASLSAGFPQCGNGYIFAEADGYKTGKTIASTITGGEAAVILERKYKLNLELEKEGLKEGDYGIIVFNKDNESTTIFYPEQKLAELTEGQYEIKVYTYTNSSINLQSSSSEKCVDVPKTGIAGIFGGSDRKCFTFNIPEQIISFAVSGGGKQNYYMTESELETGKITIEAQNFGIPSSLDELQENYNEVEINGLNVYFG